MKNSSEREFNMRIETLLLDFEENEATALIELAEDQPEYIVVPIPYGPPLSEFVGLVKAALLAQKKTQMKRP